MASGSSSVIVEECRTACPTRTQRGNRKLNHALQLAAICQIRNPGTEGRLYFERKVAEGKTKKDAIRSLKRHISNAVDRRLVDDHRNREM